MSGRQSLHRRVEEVGDDAGAAAIGIALFDYHDRTAWSYHADRWFHAASMIKVPVLLGVFDAVARRRLELHSRVHVRNRFLSVADGSVFRVEATRDSNPDVQAALGRTLQVRELARHMIVTSSNLATNLLVDIVGLEEIRRTLDRFELHGIELRRGVEDMAAFDRDINNRVTAHGVMRTLRILEDGSQFSAELAGEMLEILHAQEFRSGIPAGLPQEARVANKTGEISTIAHDAGIVYLLDREPYVVVILTEWAEGGGNRKETIARLSRLVYEYVTDGEEVA